MTKISKRKIYLALVNVVVIGILTFIDTNIRYAYTGETSLYAKIEERMRYAGLSSNQLPDSILFIDVSFDQQMVPATNAYGDTIGTTPITDRHKLAELLTMLHASDDYGFVMLDVRFEKGIETPDDSLLFATIADMPRIVIPCHLNMKLASEALVPKTAMSEYGTSVFNSAFSKYEFCNDSTESIPMKMARKSFSFVGPFTFDNGKLCYRCLSIPLLVNPGLTRATSANPNYMLLGSDMLLSKDMTVDMACNRIVVIGNMASDVHSTYKGLMPGSVINLNAYIALQQGLHIVNPCFVAGWAVIYFIMLLLFMSGQTIHNFLPKKKILSSDVVLFSLSFIGNSIIITTFATILYLAFQHLSSIAIPALYLSIFNVILKYKNKRF